MNILNVIDDTVSLGESRTPEELARYLQKSMLRLKADHISSDGKGVDYSSLVTSEAFKEYVQVSQQLICCDPSLLAEEERRAFFISILERLA